MMSRFHAVLLASLLSVSCASGPMFLAYELADEKGAKRLRTLEAREAELRKKYEVLRDKKRKEIDASKDDIRKAIQANELGDAINKLDALHRTFHPCDTERCKRVVPTKDELRMRYILEHEGWDNEESFTRASLDDIVRRADGLSKKGAFDLLTGHLKDIRYRLQFYKPQHQRLLSMQKGLSQRWMKELLAQSEAHRKKHPGVALLYVLKARDVARQSKDTERSLELSRRAGAMTRAIREQYALHIQLKGADGEVARAASQALRKLKFASTTISTKKTARTQATLSVRSSAPSYRVSSRQGSDSFQYRDGTSSKPNPKFEDLVRKQKISQGNYDRCKASCGKPYVSCRINKWNGSHKILAEDRKECASLKTSLAEVSKLNNQMARTSKTVEEPAYSAKSYSFTLHTHTGTSQMAYQLAFRRGDKPLRSTFKVSSELTDREHPAYSYRGGGVAATPRELPPSSQVFGQMTKDASRWLEREMGNVLSVYLRRFLETSAKQPLSRVNSLMLYDVLATQGLPVKHRRELERLSKIPGAWDLLQ